ncbi:MAG: response regulator, partial [Planctomycetales bacterium]|nr:response regulator [Planctomycetales bacterium]
MSISVLVADDHPIIRAGIVSMLKDTEMQVVAEAATGNQAIEQTAKHHPDVVLLDI